MNIWDTDKLILFIAFAIPGFISIKTYDLLLPSERREVGKSLVDAVAYSCVNYSLLSWLILLDQKYQWAKNYPAWHIILVFLVLFAFPVIWAWTFVWLRKQDFFKIYAPHPIPKPWDYVFGNGQSYWVVVELSGGEIIGGMYDTKSFASSYPAEEQLYIQQLWEIEDNDKFIKPLERSHGAIISASEIKLIRFYQ